MNFLGKMIIAHLVKKFLAFNSGLYLRGATGDAALRGKQKANRIHRFY
jgi:hypothetical protein